MGAPQSFNDMFYILRRVVSPEEIQGAFAKAYEYIHVCSEDADDMARAAERFWPDMEDCLIALCAEKTHAKYLVTRDVKSFAGSAVEPITPKELVSRMEAERGISCEWLSEP